MSDDAPAAELAAQGSLAAVEQGVQQGVEGRSVVGMAQVAELVQDDVVLRLRLMLTYEEQEPQMETLFLMASRP